MKEMYLRALEIAIMAHGKTRGKDGHLYVMHPIRVADMLTDPKEKIVGLLHDVVEDTNWTLDRLANEGFPKDIIDAVDAITYRKGEPRKDYLDRIKANPLAKNVKLADLSHNSDIFRLSIITQTDVDRTERYQHEIAYLRNITEHKFENGLYWWRYGDFEIHQSAPNNPDGTHGPAMSYIVTDNKKMLKNVLAIKRTLDDALRFIEQNT